MYLDGLRILDFSRVLAGPLATQILADLGAEVLKVEPPGGDDTRTWGPPFQGEMAAYFQSANRSKASLVIDLRTEMGRRRAYQLARVADVVVDNYRPRTRRRLGLDGDELRRDHPGLVTVSVVGYSGARQDDPGYDLVLQAESGLMGITGPAEGEPHKVGVALVDVLSGMMASTAILAALVRRGRTGEGASLTVSLWQTALFSLVNVAASHLVSGDPTPRWGNDHPNLVPYGLFRTADRAVVIGVGNDRQYRRLLDRLEIRDQELRSFDNAARVEGRAQVVGAIQQAVASWPSRRLLVALAEDDVPAAPVLRPDEALARARVWDPGAVLAFEHRELGTIQLPALPIVGDGVRVGGTPPPRLGETGESVAARWLAAPAVG